VQASGTTPDGQNVFDPATLYAKIDWGVGVAMTRLSCISRCFPSARTAEGLSRLPPLFCAATSRHIDLFILPGRSRSRRALNYPMHQKPKLPDAIFRL